MISLGINIYSKPVLSADNTSVLLAASNLNDLQIRSASIMNYASKWLTINGLSLNMDKTYLIKFKFNHLKYNSCQIFIKTKKSEN